MTRNVKLSTLLQPADCLSICPTNSTICKPLSPLGGGLGEHFATPCFGRTQLSRKWCCFSSLSSLYLSRFFTSNYLKRDSRVESSDCVSLGMSETEAQETTKAWLTFSFISFLLGLDCYLLTSGGSRSHVLSLYRTIILTSVFSVHMCMATVHTFKYGIWNGYFFFCVTMFLAQLEVYFFSS